MHKCVQNPQNNPKYDITLPSLCNLTTLDLINLALVILSAQLFFLIEMFLCLLNLFELFLSENIDTVSSILVWCGFELSLLLRIQLFASSLLFDCLQIQGVDFACSMDIICSTRHLSCISSLFITVLLKVKKIFLFANCVS